MWMLNLLFFGGLLVLVNSLFVWHLRRTEELFLKHARKDALLIARMVSLNTETGYLADQILRHLLEHFLKNLGKFLDYLELVEPFSYDELMAFVEENHLYGLSLKRFSGPPLLAPKNWSAAIPSEDLEAAPPLVYFSDQDLFVYRLTDLKCCQEIVLVVRVKNLKNLYRKVSLTYVLGNITRLPGILYLKEEKQTCSEMSVTEKKEAVEIKVPFEARCLIVGLDNTPLQTAKRRLWQQYFLLNAFLIPLGGLLGYLFYRLQRFYLRRFEAYERGLSLRREEAALGRAAAIIAHEIKNPLNSMAIALQRLLLEGENLNAEQKQLLKLVSDSIKRTNHTVKNLLNYARLPQEIARQPVRLDKPARELLALFAPELLRKKVRLETHIEEVEIPGDTHLLSQMLENLLKNALEALEFEGFLRISLKMEGKEAVLKLVNSGEIPQEEDLKRIFEPYVTFKTRGTGLGLAIVRKIVKAHGGRIKARIRNGLFEIEIRLPGVKDA